MAGQMSRWHKSSAKIPRSEKGKEAASPPGFDGRRGKRRRVGPVSTSEVATVSMTLSPSSLGEANTQNTSAMQKRSYSKLTLESCLSACLPVHIDWNILAGEHYCGALQKLPGESMWWHCQAYGCI